MAVHFPYLDVSNCNASVRVAQNGAQIFGFDRVGEPPVLWVSPKAKYEIGKPLRGGIPICWPWFGPHEEDPDKPHHGFARVMPWELEDFAESQKGITVSSFKLTDTEETLEMWPYRFELTLNVEVSKWLDIRLSTKNRDERPFELTQALHAYFFVGNVDGVEIHGLENHEYLDKISGKRDVQEGMLTIENEIDRIYRHQGTCAIVDRRLGRQIVVEKSGSASTVVWNPWQERAQGLADFPDDGFRNVVCVEAANVLDDKVVVEPGGEVTLGMKIKVSSL